MPRVRLHDHGDLGVSLILGGLDGPEVTFRFDDMGALQAGMVELSRVCGLVVVPERSD